LPKGAIYHFLLAVGGEVATNESLRLKVVETIAGPSLPHHSKWCTTATSSNDKRVTNAHEKSANHRSFDNPVNAQS
jgi:hypothetical protein